MDKPGNKPGILAIDDDLGILDILKIGLESEGYQVHTAETPQRGLELFEQLRGRLGVVLLDYIMPDMRGDEVFRNLRRIDPKVPVLLLTACDDRVAQDMFAQGLRGYVQKPFYISQLVDQVQRILNPAV
jgi:DNA-binding response OmpR family regulator